jgi:hypothetical protein
MTTKRKAKKATTGFITSLYVVDPKVFARVKKAAKASGESVSQLLLRVGNREAAEILGGKCPTCGHKARKAA